MNSETKVCQNCKQNFTIEPDDLSFYFKINVPSPTFCPDCRRQRRMLFRNERSLYKRACDLCHENIISMYPSGTLFPVYCTECWWSDKWDAGTFSRDYDFSRPFFVQFKELLNVVPRIHLMQRKSVNTPYANHLGESKNIYLSYSVVDGEDVYYSKMIDKSIKIFDSLNSTDSQNCYEIIDGEKDYNCAFLIRSHSCLDSRFLFDCVNCRNCFMSSNLRNKEYMIRNKQYSKDEYQAQIKSFNTKSFSQIENLKSEFNKLIEESLHKYANIIKSVKTTGDNLISSKNCRACFDLRDIENVSYIFRGFGLKDSADIDFTIMSELIYEYVTSGRNNYLVRFAVCSFQAARDTYYTDSCASVGHIFGCVGVRSKEYCILNKQYSKDEYERLIEKIKLQMDEMPYKDTLGHTYKFGEFFPIEISPFAYNETIAQEYFPLKKEEAQQKGFKWKELEKKAYSINISSTNIADNLDEVKNDIFEKVISCAHEGNCSEQCATAFRILPEELQFYQQMNLPLPRLCPNCRHYQRLKQRNPLKLWHRKCLCDYKTYQNITKHAHHPTGRCPNEFETSYSPDRKEIIYCESCYQAEIV